MKTQQLLNEVHRHIQSSAISPNSSSNSGGTMSGKQRHRQMQSRMLELGLLNLPSSGNKSNSNSTDKDQNDNLFGGKENRWKKQCKPRLPMPMAKAMLHKAKQRHSLLMTEHKARGQEKTISSTAAISSTSSNISNGKAGQQHRLTKERPVFSVLTSGQTEDGTERQAKRKRQQLILTSTSHPLSKALHIQSIRDRRINTQGGGNTFDRLRRYGNTDVPNGVGRFRDGCLYVSKQAVKPNNTENSSGNNHRNGGGRMGSGRGRGGGRGGKRRTSK